MCIITSCMLPLISDTSHWWQTFELYKWIFCFCVNSVKKGITQQHKFFELQNISERYSLTLRERERERDEKLKRKKWLVWPMTIGQDIKHFLLWRKWWDAIMTYDSKNQNAWKRKNWFLISRTLINFELIMVLSLKLHLPSNHIMVKIFKYVLFLLDQQNIWYFLILLFIIMACVTFEMQAKIWRVFVEPNIKKK